MDPDGLPQRFPARQQPPSALRSPFDDDDDAGPSRLPPRGARSSRGRGGASSRGRGGLGHFGGPFSSTSLPAPQEGGKADYVHRDPDDAVRGTDSDASMSRLSAITKGYLSDPFAPHLLSRTLSHQKEYLRPPLINLGTHARTWAMDALVRSFLLDVVGNEAEDATGQIVSLGAGSDTRYWRFQADPSLARRIGTYVELDFPAITAQKAQSIARSPVLSDSLGNYTLTVDSSGIRSPCYHLLPVDLRLPSALSTALTPLLDPRKPTLWLAECLLVYLPPEVSEACVRWFHEWSGGKGWVGGGVYEMFGFEDAFGKRMIQNLSARNIPLPSSALYPTRQSQPDRFFGAGYANAGVRDINDVRAALPASESARVRTLELLDEVEEMELLFAHYGVSWGWSAGEEGKQSVGWGF